jgi:D-erythro-7,8-dihydroneopterin triphosphate epimerase
MWLVAAGNWHMLHGTGSNPSSLSTGIMVAPCESDMPIAFSIANTDLTLIKGSNFMKPTIEVEIHKLRLRCIIGVNELERRDQQDINVTIKFKYDTAKAVASDNLEEAVNYRVICKKAISLVEQSSFFLLESLGAKLWEMVMEDSRIEYTEIVVEKPHSLRFADNAVIKVTGGRDD